MNESLARKEASRNHAMRARNFREIRFVQYAAPHSAAQHIDSSQRFSFNENSSFVDDRHPAAELGYVFDNVGRENHDSAFAYLAQQVEKAHTLSRVETRRWLVYYDEPGIRQQSHGDSESLPHST